MLLEYTHDMFVGDDEPSRFLKIIEGSIYDYDDQDERVLAGEFSIILVDAEAAVNERESVFHVFDSSSKSVDYYDLYGNDLEFKASVVRAMKADRRWMPNMLILDRLQLLPEHRGRENGLRVLRWLRLQFSAGCGVVAMKPFPLQFEGGTPDENREGAEFKRWRLDKFGADLNKSTRKLQAYYRRLGFRKVAGMPYMVADPQQRVPTLAAMGVADSF